MKNNMRHMFNTPINLGPICQSLGRQDNKIKPKWRKWVRQISIVVLALKLTSCITIPGFDGEQDIPKGVAGYVQGFYGGVAADEPHAVLVGRNILAAGGMAADAAVAMYFMLSVTYPSAASLGSGGMCLVGDNETGKVETLDFLGQISSGSRGFRVGVPSSPRGFFALHAKYGKLDWSQVIQPAENAARFGVQMSRAAATEIRFAGSKLSKTPVSRLLKLSDSGRFYAEGDTIIQRELASILAMIRNRGAGTLYNGTFARQFVASANESGAALTYGDMQALRPLWRSALEVLVDVRSSFYLPMPRTSVGTMGAKALAVSLSGARYKKSDDGLRAHLLAEAIQRALVDGARGYERVTPNKKNSRVRLPQKYIDNLMVNYVEDRVLQFAVNNPPLAMGSGSHGQTSFIAVDKTGGAVACFLSMNQRFGALQAIRGTGVILAAPPPASTEGRDLSIGLLLMSSRDKNIFFMAGASSGGGAAQSAVVQAALRAGGGTPDDLDAAISWKRLFRDPARALTYIESGTPKNIINSLRVRGHNLQVIQSMGRVNLAFCESGLPTKEPQCGFRSDPRAYGLASVPTS